MAAPWLPDNSTSKCEACRKAFDLLLRRHHCRVCGHIFCDSCSSKRLAVPHDLISRKPGEAVKALAMIQSPTKMVRVCNECYSNNRNGFPSTPGFPFNVTTQSSASQSSSRYNSSMMRSQAASEVSGGSNGLNYHSSSSNPSPGQQPDHVPTAPFAGTERVDHSQFSNYGPQNASAGHVALVSPQDAFIEGPPAPINPGPLPPFPGKTPVQRKDMGGMLSQAFSILGAAKSHQNDPHLSREQNAANLGAKVSEIEGRSGQNTVLLNALNELEQRHKPEGIEAGFVVTEPPEPGTLGHQFGLSIYDYIYGYENTLISKDTTAKQWSKEMQTAFQTKGFFVILVYSFINQRYRRIHIFVHPGNSNAILGIATMKLPQNPNEIAGVISEPSMDIMVKAWRKHGAMFVSSGANAVPLYAPLTSENADLYTKVFRNMNGMWVSSNEYHPIYDYLRLDEPLYVEAFRYQNNMLIGSGEKAPLPMERVSISNQPQQQGVSEVPGGQSPDVAAASPEPFATEDPVGYQPEAPANTVVKDEEESPEEEGQSEEARRLADQAYQIEKAYASAASMTEEHARLVREHNEMIKAKSLAMMPEGMNATALSLANAIDSGSQTMIDAQAHVSGMSADFAAFAVVASGSDADPEEIGRRIQEAAAAMAAQAQANAEAMLAQANALTAQFMAQAQAEAASLSAQGIQIQPGEENPPGAGDV